MKIKKCVINLVTYSLILSMAFVTTVYAKDSEPKTILEYDAIEECLLERNAQIISNNKFIDKLENKLDDAQEDIEEAEDVFFGQINALSSVIDQMNTISETPISDTLPPEQIETYVNIKKISQAAGMSLSLTQNNLYSQIENMEDSTDVISDQIEAARLNLEYAENTLVNATQNLFVLYHQLVSNLEQLKIKRATLSEQLDLANLRVEQGLITKDAVTDKETSLLEFDASYLALVHQQDAIILQLKGLLGFTYKDELSLGELPIAEKDLLDSIEFEKDIEEAVLNAMSIKIKDVELKNASSGSTVRKYERQSNENEAIVTFTKQYYTLLEARDNLLASESKLNSTKLKLEQGRKQYDVGINALTNLKALENEFRSQELTVKSNLMALFFETENYEAMKNGKL